MASNDIEGCLACDLTTGRLDLPGGRIYATERWVVEHCVGPLGVGTLIVKPRRHCLHVWDLTDEEAAELGPLLRLASEALHTMLAPDQVYVCLWSHYGWKPGHIHFVVQPAWNRQGEEHGCPGPSLQVDMLEANVSLPRDQVEEFASRAKETFRDLGERAP